jgi:hypothetical protein
MIKPIIRFLTLAVLALCLAKAEAGEPTVVLDTFNPGGTRGNPQKGAIFKVNETVLLVRITNYHWNNGKGAKPGIIGIRDENTGAEVTTWQASGSAGQGGVPNAFWTCEPGFLLGPGTYRVLDGDAKTWACNDKSGNRGFTRVEIAAPPPDSTEPGFEGEEAVPPDPVVRSHLAFLEAARVRAIASFSLKEAIHECPVGDKLDFLLASKTGRALPEAWAIFFSGCFVLAGNVRTDQPVIGFYNPWLDGALLTTWKWDGKRPAMTAAAMWIASDFPAPETPGTQPACARWIGDSETKALPEALVARHRAFCSAFDRAFPLEGSSGHGLSPEGSPSAPVGFVGGQAAEVLRTLIAIQRPADTRRHAGLGRLLKALADSDNDTLAGMVPARAQASADTMLKLPAMLRQKLAPTYALQGKDGTTIVFLGLPEVPRFYILVAFGPGSDGPLQLLSVHDLDPERKEAGK